MATEPTALPSWAGCLIDFYNSQAHNQFVLTGNVGDLFPAPASAEISPPPLSLPHYLQQTIVPRFDVVLRYDLGNGLRIERGGPIFSRWSNAEAIPRAPRPAIEFITAYLRYCSNLVTLGQPRIKVAVILTDAQLFVGDDNRQPDTNASAFLIREWSLDPAFTRHDLVSFILAENLNELHPLIRQNPHAAKVVIPLPPATEIARWLSNAQGTNPVALRELGSDLGVVSQQLTGATLQSLDRMLRLAQHRQEPIRPESLGRFKSEIVERECPGLLEFIAPKLTLDHLHGQEPLKRHLRQNLALWKANRLDLLPQGYLLCGPVGTGKTFFVKCLAGEAGVPVVVLKNFRDRWYGSTEGNLEKIFRTLRALGRCCVFIDEADQALGRRDSGGTEPGVSGRIYSMMAQEMSDPENRGRLLWILATSRPDLVEVDLKRPGRIDVKVPLFPTADAAESLRLIRGLAARKNLPLPADDADFGGSIPDLLTPGEVGALLTNVQRDTVANDVTPIVALRKRLANYLRPVALELILEQTRLAIAECTDAEFIPERFRSPAPSADRQQP